MIDGRVLVFIQLWQLVLSYVNHGCRGLAGASSTVFGRLLLLWLTIEGRGCSKDLALACDRSGPMTCAPLETRFQTRKTKPAATFPEMLQFNAATNVEAVQFQIET
jgi:hypothetical protein